MTNVIKRHRKRCDSKKLSSVVGTPRCAPKVSKFPKAAGGTGTETGGDPPPEIMLIVAGTGGGNPGPPGIAPAADRAGFGCG